MFKMFFLLTERLGIIMILAFLLVNTRFFRNLLETRTKKSQFWLFIIFSFFVIFSNTAGIEITNNSEVITPPVITGFPQSASIANTRTLVITTASLTCGPYVGMFVGLVGGIHRVFLGNFSDFFYIISSVIIGFLIGVLGDEVKKDKLYPSNFWIMILGFVAEMVQMVFIYAVHGFALVRLIVVPMSVLNTVGACLFMEILKTYLSNEKQLRAVQTKDVLELANKTLPYFRKGLNEQSATSVCEIIKEYTNFDAVGITNKENVLAHIGAGSDHHIVGEPVMTDMSKVVISTGKEKVALNKKEIGCPHVDCPLNSAIVVPLKVNDQTNGALKLYLTEHKKMTVVEKNLVDGLAVIFSGQLALGITEKQKVLLTEAEIKALEVQINPHFFFNSINTIIALMRFDTEKARLAMLELSHFFRSSLKNGQKNTVTIKQEKEHVDSFMKLEKLRFPDRFDIRYDIFLSEDVLIPSFCIQMLVENTVRHAFKGKKKDNKVLISIKKLSKKELLISVTDNGKGIDSKILSKIGKEPVSESGGTGTALYNLNERIQGLYGAKYRLEAMNNETGATFKLTLPLFREEE